MHLKLKTSSTRLHVHFLLIFIFINIQAKNPIKQALMGQYSGFVDSKLQSYNVEEIKLMICCAEHCVYKPSTDRPRIREV